MKNKNIKSFGEFNENSNSKLSKDASSSISDVSDSEIIVGNKYTIEKHDTKVVVIEKDDDKKKAFVSSDLIDKTGGFWINYNKLK